MKGETIFLKHLSRMTIAIWLLSLLPFNAFAFATRSGGDEMSRQESWEIRGRVVDENGTPVIGASVMIGASGVYGAITDQNGNFSLRATQGSVLTISFLGYKTQKVTVRNHSVLDIVLEEDRSALDEVVVVGYGTQKKGNLTTAISSIKNDEIVTTISTSLSQRLAGKVAGLQIRQNSGSPGEYNSVINVRGFGTPLIIVDGTTRLSSEDFQKMNPDDIENISVLKDGSAAVYGMNAANGVILVTTKRGEAGLAKFTYDATVSFSKPTNIPSMSNAYQYLVMRNDANVNVGLSPLYTKDYIEKWKNEEEGYESVDWYDLVMKKGAIEQQQTLSVSGGSDKVKYFASIGYTKDPGLLRSGSMGYEKYMVRSNITAQLTKNLSAEVDMNGWYEWRRASNYSFFEIFRGTVGEQPIHKPYANNNLEYLAYVYDGQVYNPMALSDDDVVGYWKYHNKSYHVSGTLTYDFPFLKGLQFKGLAYYEHGSSTTKSLKKEFRLYSYDSDKDAYIIGSTLHSPTSLDIASNDGNGITFQAHAIYKNTFSEKHNVSITGVYEQRKYWSSGLAAARDFDVYLIDQLPFGNTKDQRTSAGESDSGFRSWVGRFAYDYMGKYMLEYSFRYDGSYRYAPGHRWGFFPVYSVGWRASEEKFIKDNVPFLSNLKFRFSYGKAGEDAGSAFQYVGGFVLNQGASEFMNGTWTSGAKAPGLTNENLTWYKSAITNFGVDLGLFNGELNFTFDAYRRNRRGLLATRSASLPNTFGASLPQENLNKDRVSGFDMSADFNKRLSDDWRIFASGNFNWARTKTIYVEGGTYTNSYNKWRGDHNGRWQDVAWMYDYIGQFEDMEDILNSPLQNGTLGNSKELPGDFKYADKNNDGVVDGDDLTPQGYLGTPKIFYGFSYGFQFKNLDFYMLWQGAAKYTLRFTHYYATMLWNDANLPEYFYDRWHLSDQFDPNSEWIEGEWPAIRNQADVGAMYWDSDRWRRNASYLRLKTVSIGYNLPKPILKYAGIKDMRISLNCYNLLTICNKFVKPFDPEKYEGTLNSGWVYPLMKSFSVNVNVSF